MYAPTRTTQAASPGSGSSSRPRRSSTRSGASSTCTSWPSRTPSAPTSGRSSRSTATRCSSSSRPSATSATEELVDIGEVMVFVGPDFLITVRHGEAGGLGDVREQLELQPELLALGPGAALHAIVDRIVDAYEPVAEGVRDDDRRGRGRGLLSPAARTRSSGSTASAARCSSSRRATGPLRRPARADAARTCPTSTRSWSPYFRDVADHAARVADQVEGVRRPARRRAAGER